MLHRLNVFSHHHYLQLHSKAERVVASLTLRQFAISSVSIFIPIYLYELGFSLRFIGIYFVCSYLAKLCVEVFSRKIIYRYGIHHVLTFSYIAAAAFTIFMYLVPEYPLFLLVSIPAFALFNGLFWVSRHTDIASIFKTKQLDRSTGIIIIAGIVASIIAPLVGGVLSENFGVQIALLLSFAILLLATALLVNEMHAEKRRYHYSPHKLNPRSVAQDLTANFAMNYESSMATFLWPLFIFIAVAGYQTIGFVLSLNAIAIVVLTEIIRRRKNRHRAIMAGSIIRAASFAARPFASTLGRVVGIDLIGAISVGFISSPYTAQYYVNARRAKDIIGYVIAMEVAGDIAKLLLWALVAFASTFLDDLDVIKLMFVSALPFIFLINVIRR